MKHVASPFARNSLTHKNQSGCIEREGGGEEGTPTAVCDDSSTMFPNHKKKKDVECLVGAKQTQRKAVMSFWYCHDDFSRMQRSVNATLVVLPSRGKGSIYQIVVHGTRSVYGFAS